MKRPVTSLCRRPGKKTACGAVCPRCGNNFRPRGRSAAGRRSCRAKAARTRAQKQPPAGAGDCAQAAPTGKRQAMGVSGTGKHHTGHPPGQRARPGTKTAPAEAGNCAQAAPMGERRASCVGWCLESTALGARRGRGHARAQKQPPAGAGGCLDAGYGCYYLPRAIRVIWMHRVGSTARPRIMPS